MDGKLNILLVVGKSQSLRAFDLLEPMVGIYALRAASFLHTLRKPNYLSQIALQTFVEDQHLPGYMLGLEDELARADLVIASGFSDQATQQSLRYCHQHNKTLLIFSCDPIDLRWAMDQDQIALGDLLKFAKGFLVYGEELAESLRFLGIEDDRILSLSPQINTQSFGFQQSDRDRFRNYLKLAPDEFLVICSDPLARDCGARSLLFALKRLTDTHPEIAQRFRLLFTGSGDAKEKLKYLAVDLGLAKQLLFIAQDTSPFQKDLLCAADLAVSWIHRSDLESAHASFWILEAMACGVRPLVGPRHPIAEALAAQFTVEMDDYSVLAREYQRAWLGQIDPEFSRHALMSQCRERFDASKSRPHLQEFFARLDAQCPGGFGALHQDFARLMEGLNLKLGRVSATEMLPTIDEGLQAWAWHPDYRSQLQLFKGHMLLAANDLEGAMACFELCTADECVHREAYLGLARIAYMTYAAEEALSFYRKALAIRPNDPETMAGLGHVYRKTAMPDDAVYWLGRSLSVDIDNETTLFALTQSCLECVDQERAIDVLEQLKSIIGEHASVVMALGQLYYKVGECEKGRILVDQALLITAQKPLNKWIKAPSNVG